MLSVIIITKNEAEHISGCLASVCWADEIIVLDSGSNDNTVELCKAYTDKVFMTDWPGFGVQKQRALDKASHDWVLSLDADEQVSQELRAEIEHAMQNHQFEGFEMPRLSSYCGKQIRHGGWWPDYVLRLFRRECGRFSNSLVHEKIFVEGKIGRLSEPLLHESFVSLEEVLHKVDSYSTLNAKMLYERGVKSSLSKAIIKATWNFFRTYIVKLSILDGSAGLMLALSNAEGTYYKYAKLVELHKQQNIVDKLISVIVSTYNRPDALEACIKSLLQQTEHNFEIIIADDGSTEATKQLISSIALNSPVPIIHVFQPDTGFQLSRIRNKAVAKSNGVYLVFIDGDCMVRPNFVAKHRQLASPKYFVAGNRMLLEKTLTEEVLLNKQKLYLENITFFIGLRLAKKINRLAPVVSIPLGIFRYLQPNHWRKAVGCNTAIWKKDLLVVNGYDESFVGWGHEDSDLVIRLMHAGVKRKEGRFAVPVLHLWHEQNNRADQPNNYRRLLDRLEQKNVILAEKGIDQYLCQDD